MRTHKKGKCGLVHLREGGGVCWGRIITGFHANESTLTLKSSFVNSSTPTFPPCRKKAEKKNFCSSRVGGLNASFVVFSRSFAF